MMDLNEMRDGVGAHWPFLSDAGRRIQKELDIQVYTDPHHDPMIPHTLVLEPGLVIYKIYRQTREAKMRVLNSVLVGGPV